MANYLQEWLGLLLRWAHLITGVAWIGASFYFNWLENHLERRQSEDGSAGSLWSVHGGGFYLVRKFPLGPGQLPPKLHWFKFEAYATWLTGFALLCTVYYWNAGAYMIDRSVADIPASAAIGAGLLSMLISWFIYDGLCRSALRHRPPLLAALVFVWFVLLAWLLGRYLGGRAAFIHVGAAIGTVMAANVFRVIIPAQKDLVAAIGQGRKPDAQQGADALMRSRHNNYLTLPVLFIMISIHYPGTYGHPWNWLVLAAISVFGIGVRHWFNIRHLSDHGRWILPVCLALLAGMIAAQWPRTPAPEATDATYPATSDVMPIVTGRCVTCHAAEPDYPGFATPPLGVVLETAEDLERAAPRVLQSAVITRTMPLGNITGMTEDERKTLARWYAGRMRE